MGKLRTIQEVIPQVIQYITDRRDGKITSLRTGYKKLDASMIDGIEWHSTITIGGRPSVGKSAFSDCIVEGCFNNNLENGAPNFTLLDFNYELSSQVTLLRRLAARTKKTYKYVLSADNNKLTDAELQAMVDILVDYYGTLPIMFGEEPESVEAWGKTVEQYLMTATKPTLVRLDHTLLVKQVASETSQVQMLMNLLMKANYLKKKYPVIFMFLTQINREFEDRQENGSEKAFPRQGDVYGGDAAAMFSETMLLLNKPSKYEISYYGKRPGGKSVDLDDLFVHAVKNRNADPSLILHFKENFKHMSINEF